MLWLPGSCWRSQHAAIDKHDAMSPWLMLVNPAFAKDKRRFMLWLPWGCRGLPAWKIRSYVAWCVVWVRGARLMVACATREECPDVLHQSQAILGSTPTPLWTWSATGISPAEPLQPCADRNLMQLGPSV